MNFFCSNFWATPWSTNFSSTNQNTATEWREIYFLPVCLLVFALSSHAGSLLPLFTCVLKARIIVCFTLTLRKACQLSSYVGAVCYKARHNQQQEIPVPARLCAFKTQVNEGKSDPAWLLKAKTSKQTRKTRWKNRFTATPQLHSDWLNWNYHSMALHWNFTIKSSEVFQKF